MKDENFVRLDNIYVQLKMFNCNSYGNECNTYQIYHIFSYREWWDYINTAVSRISSVKEIKFDDVPCDASL